MRVLTILPLALLTACGGGGGGNGSTPTSHWTAIRAAAAPAVALAGEFGTPQVQPLATDGWEDGIWISRDGLQLFCVYAPADLLSLTIDDPTQLHAADYLRGPTFGMDLVTNPAGRTTWVHGDILHATRSSPGKRFTTWQRAALSQPVFSEGAPQGLDPGAGWGLFVYTTNAVAPYKAQIALLRDTGNDPAGSGTILPTVNTDGLTSDNPHIERLGPSDLVLFFDSADRGGTGGLDLWYATSADDGATWTVPAEATSLDTAADEEQPHLYNDGTDWWLYFTATNSGGDGKLGIFRAKRAAAGWNAWGARELVVAAGNTAGVGEPSLTAAGDLSFVVVYEDTVNGTATDRYDADPWFAPHVPSGIGARSHASSALGVLLSPAAGR